MAAGDTSNDDVEIDEIRDMFANYTAEWKEIREEGSKDITCISGNAGVWRALDPAGYAARTTAVRPCASLDELTQYINQGVNNLRQNPRGIIVSPQGNGANDKTANFLQGWVRQIEYRSNAQQAYMFMAENMYQRGYGALRITPRYCGGEGGRNQELWIEPIPNPDMFTPDPWALRPDGSDMRGAFFHESMSLKDFKREYPGAKPVDFALNPELLTGSYSAWFGVDRVTIAECWKKVKVGTRKKLFLKPLEDDSNQDPLEVYEDDEALKGVELKSDRILHDRDIDKFEVTQRITNGLESLKKAKWSGKSIPFVTCFGKILYVNVDGMTKRQLQSLIRLAREAALKHAFIDSCELEIIGAVPRALYVGYKGQFHQPHEWNRSTHEPVMYLESNAYTEEHQQGSGGPLPLPQRQSWDPPLQNLEIAKESSRRAIQAAVGISPLPTDAQRQNQKSGKALDRIEASGQRGSFHFDDHYNEGVTRTGQILVELAPFYLDTPRELSIRDKQDKVQVIDANDPIWQEWDKNAYHDVTISLGPAKDSEREANSEFADSILANDKLMAVMGPQKALKLAAQAVKLKGAGPIGDSIADLMDPKQDGEPDPQQLAAENQQLKGQLQQAGQAVQQLQIDSMTKKAELDSKERIALGELQGKERLEIKLQEMKNATTIAVAHINAASKGLAIDAHAAEEAMALGHEAEQAELARAHDVGKMAMGHGQALQQGQQGHEQAIEQADQGHMQTLEQSEQAAALAPQPEMGAGA